MLSWRFRRQLAVLLVFAALLAVAGVFLFYKFFPEPTCFDNRKNQKEIGVDCGGPCLPCELKNPKQISVFWARAVPVRENAYDVAAFVENPNTVLASDRIEYEFTLFDEYGPVAVKEGSTFIDAGETTHVIEANLKTVREATRVEFEVKKANWRLRNELRLNVVVERKEYKVVEQDGKKTSVVEATLLNRGAFDFKEAEVNFTVLDSDGNLLGTNKILVEKLRSGESKMVKSVWPSEFPREVTKIDVEPRINMFLQDIIIKPQ